MTHGTRVADPILSDKKGGMVKNALWFVLILVVVTGCTNPVEPTQIQLTPPNGSNIPPVLPEYAP